jgi:hypothetical protein
VHNNTFASTIVAFAPHALHRVDLGSCMCICNRSRGAGTGDQKESSPRGVQRSRSVKLRGC